ncbi:unnamed protein product [Caenorhabditis sp. 36 PRJEB53466]|nr:unnamed protein product [Caenorhabditis sp. 36 PRJEB53466]
MILRSSVFLLFFLACILAKRIDLQNRGEDDSEEEEEEEEEDEQLTDKKSKSMYEFLYKRMNQEVVAKKRLSPNIYTIPGPQEPLPGRSHQGDYWPVFPFQNQYSGGLDLDPAISRHIGGDFNLAVPSQHARFGEGGLCELMSDPAMHANRHAHPTLPLGKFGKTYVPLNCKPPMCNPYQMNFGLGIEHDWGGSDGVEGDIDVPLPVSKGIAYRMPFSGNVYYNRDNVTVTYGQNLGPIEPFSSLFDYQKTRDPALAIPRRWTRSIREPVEMQQRSVTQRKMMMMMPPGMGFMPYPNAQTQFLPQMMQQPYYKDYRHLYPSMIPYQFVQAPIKRRRKYRVIPNYHYVYF